MLTTRSFFKRAFGVVAVALSVAASFAAAPAGAGCWSAPAPGLQSVDRFGVELSNGSVQVSSPTISIGDPNNGGLSYTATWDSSARAWRSSTWGGVNKAAIKSDPNCFAYITVTALGQTGTFQQDTCTGAYERQDGLGTLTRSGNIWTYTGPDGTVATYDYAQRTSMGAAFSANQGAITSITRPNGEILTFTSTSVSNNFGYQLHFEYNSDGSYTVTALNNAVDACPLTAACTYSTTWPSLTFSAVGNEQRVTDALGYTTRLIFDSSLQPNLIGVVRPTTGAGSSITYTQGISHPNPGYRVLSASDGVGTWTYVYEPWVCASSTDINPTCDRPTDDYELKTTVTAPATVAGQPGAQTIYHFTWRYPAFSFGEVTHSFDGVTDASGTRWWVYMDGGGLASVTYPEGNHVGYGRDYFTGVPTGAGWTPKTGSGLATVSTLKTYPACTGSNPILCRRPTSMTDVRGGVTDYTYDAAGNLLTETGPAPTPGAARPQTRYTWEQRYAWYKQNGAATISQAASPVWVLVKTSQCVTGATCQ